ncbi:MAG: SH3 domain-containing protein, partial [Chloroflexi bacterium]|nr:SH3 domain-containing protein [Chloroflexota bacterium]
HIENHRVPPSLIIAALLTLVLLIPLSYYSVKFFNEAAENRNINTVVNREVALLGGAELIELDVERNADGLRMIVTVRTNTPLLYNQVAEMQHSIATNLQRPITLKVNQVLAKQFDPLIPPTLTATVQVSPTPTRTLTPTLTPTQTPTATFTATPTPGLVQAANGTLPPFKIYQSPNGPIIGTITHGQTLILLYERREVDGLIWLNVMDGEGRIGWIPEIYLNQVTATP